MNGVAIHPIANQDPSRRGLHLAQAEESTVTEPRRPWFYRGKRRRPIWVRRPK